MTDDYKRHLIDGDPVAREPELDAFHAQAMRQRVVLEVASQPAAAAPGLWWLRPIAVAGAVAACLVVAIVVGLRIDSGDVSRTYVERPFQGRGQGREQPRQMQFSSPGGTRIIWTFHDRLEL